MNKVAMVVVVSIIGVIMFFGGYFVGLEQGYSDGYSEGCAAYNEIFRQGVHEGYCTCSDLIRSGWELDPQTEGTCYGFQQDYIFSATEESTNFWVNNVVDGNQILRRVSYYQPVEYKTSGKDL
jgi:hypothetical protein